jgi:hypothetical protein
MTDGHNNDDMLIEDGFTFTGLLEGKFDSFYTPDASKKKVRLRKGKLYSHMKEKENYK